MTSYCEIRFLTRFSDSGTPDPVLENSKIVEKSKCRRIITFVEDEKTEANHKNIADIFNNSFANVVTSLEILEFDNVDETRAE